jgi:cell division protein FtsB
MNWWAAIYRFACGVVVLLSLAALVCVFLPKCHRLRELQRRRLHIEEQNRRLEARIHDLLEKERQFKTNPAFVERIAREAGMSRTNETVYRLDDAP